MPGKKRYTLGQQGPSAGLHDVTLPSGATCQARRPGVEGLIAMGVLDSFDELTALVKTEHLDRTSTRGVAGTPKVTTEDVQQLMANKDKIGTALVLIDRLTAGVVTQPKVWVDYQFKGEPDEEFAKRSKKAAEDEAIAARDVDLEDKVFLLNWAVGGSSDLALFRQGRQQLVADVAAS